MKAARISPATALPARLIPPSGATPARIRGRDLSPVYAHKPPRHYYRGAARTVTMHRELRHKNCIPGPVYRVPAIPWDHSGTNGPGCVA